MGTSNAGRMQRAVALATAAVLVAFGLASIIKGLDGRSTVSSSLKQEHIKGQPFMSPAGIAARAKAASLTGVDLPDCSVAGKAITGGDSARCFAEYMRIDALIVTGGKTYAQMPSFVSKEGGLTSDFAEAKKLPSGAPVGNPPRQSWVTETALARRSTRATWPSRSRSSGSAPAACCCCSASCSAASRSPACRSRGALLRPTPAERRC